MSSSIENRPYRHIICFSISLRLADREHRLEIKDASDDIPVKKNGRVRQAGHLKKWRKLWTEDAGSDRSA